MNQISQENLDVCGNFCCGLPQHTDSIGLTLTTGRYTAPVTRAALGRRVKELRGNRTLEEIDEKAGIGKSRLSKLERGVGNQPTFATLVQVAKGLECSLAELFTDTRPEEGEAGRDGRRRTGREATDPLADYLRRAADRIDVEFPGEDSWQGDVQKAIAALARALRRQATTTEPRPKTGKA